MLREKTLKTKGGFWFEFGSIQMLCHSLRRTRNSLIPISYCLEYQYVKKYILKEMVFWVLFSRFLTLI
jgi:hypothetical protein